MTVAQCEEQVLRYLDEVGVSDYGDRMIPFINEAQTVIATQWGFLRKKVTLQARPGETVALPLDCYAVERVPGAEWSIDPLEEGSTAEGITLSGSETGYYTIVYKAYPDLLDDEDMETEIQLPREYHTALCCLVAALTQHNETDEPAYQIFMNRYNDQVAMIERAKTMAAKARVITNGRII